MWRCGVLALAVLLASPARADWVRGVLAPVQETGHEVSLTVHRGYVVWEAERRFVSDGADQAIVHLALADLGGERGARGVATGLRLFTEEGWRSASLMEAGEAERRFSSGGGDGQAAALLQAGFGVDEAILRIAGMRPGVERRVGYRVSLPLAYEEGRYRFALPAWPADASGSGGGFASVDGWAPSRGRGPATVRVRGVDGRVTVAGRPWRDGDSLSYRAGLEIALEPGGEGAPWTVDGALGVVPFGDRFLTHARIEVAPRLSAPPRAARVVLVLDTSRSVGEATLAGALAAARAYLAHLPDAEVEVVQFDRGAHRRYGRFVAASTARHDLRRWLPPRRNGSEIGDALELAETLSTAAGGDRPRRIVVFTDALTRSGLDVAQLAQRLPEPGPVIHVVKLEEHAGRAPYLRPDEGDVWDALTARRGGLSWLGSASAEPNHRRSLSRLVERLVRPTRFRHLSASSSPFVDVLDLGIPSEMKEGRGLSQIVLMDQPIPWLRVEGRAWRERRSVTLPVSEAEGTIWAALAFGSDVLPVDERRARTALARRGRVVTEHTSYVVGRVALPPIRERGGVGRFLAARHFSTTCRGGRSRHPSLPARPWLERRLREALEACGSADETVSLELETTGPEVVAVGPVSLVGGLDEPLARCVEEAVWALALPPELFVGRSQVAWVFEIASRG